MSENKYNNNLKFGTGVQAPVPLKFSPFCHRHDNTNNDSYVMSDFSESSSNIGGPVKGSSTSSSSASDEDDSCVDLSDFLTTERGYVEQLTSLLSYMERREQKDSDLYDTISNIKRIHSISKETWSIESWVRRIVFGSIISLLTLSRLDCHRGALLFEVYFPVQTQSFGRQNYQQLVQDSVGNIGAFVSIFKNGE
jgi:hypothetical protein